VAGSVEFHEEVTLETQLATGITLAIRILKAAQTGGDVGDALSGFIEGEVPTEVREWLRGTAEVLYEGIRDGEQVGFSVAMLTSVAMALSGVADQCGEDIPPAKCWRIWVDGQSYLTCDHTPPHTRPG
jgi:hypothetical protein